MGRKRTTPLPAAVRELMQLAGVKTVRELATWYGYSYGRVANWSKRGVVPEEEQSKGIALAAARARPIEPSIDHEKHRSVGEPNSPYAVELSGALPAVVIHDAGVTINLSDGKHFEVIPRFSARVSAGRGAGEQHDEQVGEFAFEVSWMRRNLGRTGKGFGSVTVRGDSMEPTLLNGDEIIIDRQAVRVDVNGIYVIGLRGDLLVKRVQRMLDGSLVVRSDNPAYQPETLSAEKADEFRVVGRMVWPRVR